MVSTWMNTIALNIHRSYIRREPFLQILPELPTPPKVNLAAIDVRRILKCCKTKDRLVLHRYYIEGYKVQEIAKSQGWTETAVRPVIPGGNSWSLTDATSNAGFAG
jgi:DNA-directed RNA polymerase specialized sigma24 family protein